jgi:predicted NUDIX family phosphoesterase
MNQERVLCFSSKLLDNIGQFQGINLDPEKYLLPILTSTVSYQSRDTVETDTRYKQLIPYVLVVCGDKILRYRRGAAGGEKRLHGLYSIGVGGHISNQDRLGYFDGMRRELEEELDLKIDAGKNTIPAVAVINDDTTPVGSVHFGVVHVLLVKANADTYQYMLLNHCPDLENAEFIPFDQAVKDVAQSESWSAFCLSNLDALIAKASE